MKLCSIRAVLLALVLARPALAADADSFAALAKANAYPLMLEAGDRLSGAGVDLIAREAAKAQFFMVGEQHATAGIARVNLGLHRLAARQGYDHAALEIGPHSTQAAERLVRSGRGRLAAFIRQPGHGFVFPFLGWAEEAALVEQIVALAGAGEPVLWGIDQEFIGSAPLHLARLRTLAHTAEQEAVVAELTRRAAGDALLVGTMDAAAYGRLRRAFAKERDPEAARLIEELAVSSSIYAPFLGRAGARHTANSDRETYMKRQFLAHFARAEAALGRPPKTFFKFGANHAMRGHSLSEVPALGNFLAEWGLSRNFAMLNIAVDCLGGQQSDPRTGERSTCEPYVMLPADSPLKPSPAPGVLTVFDLRPLRAAMPPDIDPATKRLVLAFDLYIPVREPAPATLLAQPRPQPAN